MKIYVAHSRDFDYKNELYSPIKNDALFNEHNFVLPHELEEKNENTRDFYKTLDIVIAECSYPSTGLGIELGWLYDDKIPIYCIYKIGKKISDSIKTVTSNIYEYKDINDMIEIIRKIIKESRND